MPGRKYSVYEKYNGTHAPACDIAKSESATGGGGRGEEGQTFQMSQLCVCLALSVPRVSRTPFEKPRILAKLPAEANSSDYLAFPVGTIFPPPHDSGKFSVSHAVLSRRVERAKNKIPPKARNYHIYFAYLKNSIHVRVLVRLNLLLQLLSVSYRRYC